MHARGGPARLSMRALVVLVPLIFLAPSLPTTGQTGTIDQTIPAVEDAGWSALDNTQQASLRSIVNQTLNRSTYLKELGVDRAHLLDGLPGMVDAWAEAMAGQGAEQPGVRLHEGFPHALALWSDGKYGRTVDTSGIPAPSPEAFNNSLAALYEELPSHDGTTQAGAGSESPNSMGDILEYFELKPDCESTQTTGDNYVLCPVIYAAAYVIATVGPYFMINPEYYQWLTECDQESDPECGGGGCEGDDGCEPICVTGSEPGCTICEMPCDPTGLIPEDPACIEGPCPVPAPCEAGVCGVVDHGAPNVSKPHPTVGRTLESPIGQVTPASGPAHDWDLDGIPDMFDAVNLPHEARSHTTTVDVFRFIDGADASAFALLIEPSHSQAQLITADPVLLPDGRRVISAAEALDLISATHSTAVRNAIGMVLHADMEVVLTPIVAAQPAEIPLRWPDDTIHAGDGTWLLLRSDPTDTVAATLAGIEAPLSEPAASNFAPPGAASYRWEFINLHQVDNETRNICYDPTSASGLTECRPHQWPGWIRAYSGNAAAVLRALHAGLEREQVPLVELLPTVNDRSSEISTLVNSTEENGTRTAESIVAQARDRVNKTVENTTRFLQETKESASDLANETAENATRLFNETVENVTREVNETIENMPREVNETLSNLTRSIERQIENRTREVNETAETGKRIVKDTLQNASATANETKREVERYVDDWYVACQIDSLVEFWCRLVAPTINLTIGGITYGVSLIENRTGIGPDAINETIDDPTTIVNRTQEAIDNAPNTINSSVEFVQGVVENPPGGGHLEMDPDSLEELRDQLYSTNKMDIFDPDSPLHIIGDASKRFRRGIGVDYALETEDGMLPILSQVPTGTIDGPTTAGGTLQPRWFAFEGFHVKMPATPRDLEHMKFRIDPADGNHTARTFLIDGAAIAQIMDVRPGEVLEASIDDAHQDGFRWVSADATGDGVLDILVHVPHFSSTWVEISNPANNPHWQAIAMSSATHGWVVGAENGFTESAVYEYVSGQLQRHNVQGMPTELYFKDIHMVSANEWWGVTHGCGGGASKPYVYHYDGGATDAFPISSAPQACTQARSVWFSDDGTVGYVGTAHGTIERYFAGTWTRHTDLGHTCAVDDIELDQNENGYAAVDKESDECPDEVPIHTVSSSGSSPATVDRDDWAAEAISQDQRWAVAGEEPHNGRPVWKRSFSSWSAEGGFPDNSAVLYDVTTIGDEVWAVGCEDASCSQTGVYHKDSSWSRMSPNYELKAFGVSFPEDLFGFVAGDNLLLRYEEDPVPVARASVDPSSGSTKTTFEGTDTGSSDPHGYSLVAREWDWGDGTILQGADTSHAYDDIGSFTARYRVKNSAGFWSKWDRQTLSVAPEPLDSNGEATGSFGSGEKIHHYRIGSSSQDRYIELGLSAVSGVVLKARLDAAADSVGKWPEEGSQGSELTGLVPAGSRLYVAVEHPAGSSSGDYTLTSNVIASPDPPIVSVPTLINGDGPALAEARSYHHDGLGVALYVDWGDGSLPERSPPNGFDPEGSLHSWSHTFADVGEYAVDFWAEDELGQTGTATSRQITVHFPPDGAMTQVLDSQFDSVEVEGSLDDLGGAGMVDVRYRVYRDGNLVSESTISTQSTTGPLPAHVFTGLTAGTTYDVVLWMRNDVATVESPSMIVETLPDLEGVKPEIVSSTMHVDLGETVTMDLRPDTSYDHDVAYLVDWGNDIQTRYPATGFVAPTTTVTATHTYGFARAGLGVEVRLENEFGARSSRLLTTAVVDGGSPIDGFDVDIRLDDVTLRVGVGALAFPGETDLRLFYRTPDWTRVWAGPWLDVDGSTVAVWDTAQLEREFVYELHAELETDQGAQWSGKVGTFNVNRRPTLEAITESPVRTYLEEVRFQVRYQDAEGDAPLSGYPELTVDGKTYTMHKSPDSGSDYVNGVNYYYQFQAGELEAGQSYRPSYIASNAHHYSPTVIGDSVLVKQSGVAFFDFLEDETGGGANGFTLGDEENNLWHVTDTGEDDMPDRIAAGGRGNALWFAREQTGSYETYDGSTPKGSIRTQALDLSIVMDPVLSFSSFYETEDTGSVHDSKKVYVQTRDGSEWSSWQMLYQVMGHEGGFGQWRTQSVSLSEYAGEEVRIKFEFDAGDDDNNQFLGWLIDDITVGHDHDGDSLPDLMEDRMWRITNPDQLGSKDFDDAWTVLEVKPIHRPHAESFVLRGLIQHPSPQELEVEVGAVRDGVARKLWDLSMYQDSFQVPDCRVDPRNYVFLSGNGEERNVVEEVADGLDVFVDLTACGDWALTENADAFEAPSAYYLKVRDSRLVGDAEEGTIEMLHLYVSGRTDKLTEDTDGDGENDRVEQGLMRDSVGHDADRDGIPENFDLDESVPNQVPEMDLVSEDFSEEFEFGLIEPLVPVPYFSADAIDPESGDSRSLDWVSVNPFTFNVDMDDEVGTPTDVRIQWGDANGGRTVLDYGFDFVEGKYLPIDLDVSNRDPVNNSDIDLSYVIDRDHPATGYRLVHCLHDFFGPPPADVEAIGEYGLKTLAKKKLQSGSRFVPLFNVANVLHWSTMNPTGIACSHSISGLAGTEVYGNDNADVIVGYDQSDVDEFEAAGVPELELVEAVRFGVPTKFTGGEHFSNRLVYTPGGSLTDYDEVIVLGTIAGGRAERVVEAWKWRLPNNPGDSGTWSADDVLALEAHLTKGLPSLGGSSAKQSSVTNFGVESACGKSIDFVPVDTLSDGDGVEFEQSVPLDSCGFQPMRLYLEHEQELSDWSLRQDRTDALYSEVIWRNAKNFAQDGDSPSDLSWYYDGSSTPPMSCNEWEALFGHSDIRRCNTYDPAPHWSDYEAYRSSASNGAFVKEDCIPYPWGTSTWDTQCEYVASTTYLSSFVSSRTMDWISAGQSEYLDLVTADTSISAVQDQQQFPGKTWKHGALEQAIETMDSINPSGIDADVFVVADDRSAILDFRRS